MAAAATNSSTFHLFSSLALELRDQIWRDALPDKVGPALYFYRKGGWCPRHLLQSDKEYDSQNHEFNLIFEFRHDLLDVVQVEVLLFSVNREARNIALAWVREHDVEIRAREDRQSPVFVCPFNPTRDVLYIALNKWDEFLREPDDRCFQPDILGQLINGKPADVTRIAVPEALFRNEIAAALAYILDRYFCLLQVLFIIVDTQPDLQSADNDIKVQRRWELESIQGEVFFWNNDRGGFDFKNSENIGDEALYKLLGEANKGLGEELVKNHIRSFEIRPVFAVKN